MGVLLIFTPCETAPHPSMLAARGLRALLNDDLREVPKSIRCYADRQGPGGLPGAMYTVGGQEDEAAEYDPDAQTWIPCRMDPGVPAGATPAHYVGFVTADPPGPDELRRENLQQGEQVELGDGKHWQVPFAMNLRGTPVFDPVTSEIISTEPSERNETLFLLAAELMLRLTQYAGIQDGYKQILAPDFYLPGTHTLAIASLQVNYRLIPAISDALGLLAPESTKQAALAATGLRSMTNLHKNC